jgi:hypothetical protein
MVLNYNIYTVVTMFSNSKVAEIYYMADGFLQGIHITFLKILK